MRRRPYDIWSTPEATDRRGDRSRIWITLLVLGATLLGSPAAGATLAAQTRADSLADSLAAVADRIARTEELLKMLRQQVAQLAREKSGTASKTELTFSGRVLANGFVTDGRANLNDVPTVALAPLTPPGGDVAAFDGSAGGSFRQTTLAMSLRGPSWWGGRVTARAEADFFGGVQDGSGGRRQFPEPRLRIATASVQWTHGSLGLGQDTPLTSDVVPVTTSAIGLPLFAGAGHLWFWLPQVRAGVQTAGAVRIALDGAITAPWAGEAMSADSVDRIDAAERAQRPSLQARLALRWGEDERAGLLGVGAHYGWIQRATGEQVESKLVSVMLHAPLAEWIELRGTWYRGEALRGLGGGGVSQSFGTGGVPLRDTGGWAQLVLAPVRTVQLVGGCGVSDPDDAQTPVRRHNRHCEGGVTWRPGGLPLFGVSYRRISTGYAAGTQVVRHLNFVTGVEF